MCYFNAALGWISKSVIVTSNRHKCSVTQSEHVRLKIWSLTCPKMATVLCYSFLIRLCYASRLVHIWNIHQKLQLQVVSQCAVSLCSSQQAGCSLETKNLLRNKKKNSRGLSFLFFFCTTWSTTQWTNHHHHHHHP